VLISLALFLIAVFDIRHHRIPNSFLLLLALFSLIELDQEISAGHFLHTSALVSFFTLVSRCGYGDSKLAMVLLNFVIPGSQMREFLLNLVIASALLMIIHLIRSHSLRGEIAFAPALCGAVLAMTP
jgi:Flp pilus assembly protein protease CpaA